MKIHEGDQHRGALSILDGCLNVDYPSAPRRAVFPKPDFWSRYNALPDPIREQADQAFELLKKNSRHPSLHFKKVGRFWSARVGLHYRAVGVEAPDGIVWFWIGTHTEYDKLIR